MVHRRGDGSAPGPVTSQCQGGKSSEQAVCPRESSGNYLSLGSSGADFPHLSEHRGIFQGQLTVALQVLDQQPQHRLVDVQISVRPELPNHILWGGAGIPSNQPWRGALNPEGRAPAFVSAATSYIFKFDSQMAVFLLSFLSLWWGWG